MSTFSLSTDQIESFQRDGFLVVKSAYDRNNMERIQRGIYEIVGLVMKQNGTSDYRSVFSPDRFDDGFNNLIGIDRVLGSLVYVGEKGIDPVLSRSKPIPEGNKYTSAKRPCAVCLAH